MVMTPVLVPLPQTGPSSRLLIRLSSLNAFVALAVPTLGAGMITPPEKTNP